MKRSRAALWLVASLAATTVVACNVFPPSQSAATRTVAVPQDLAKHREFRVAPPAPEVGQTRQLTPIALPVPRGVQAVTVSSASVLTTGWSPASTSSINLDAKLLVITATGNEPELGAITQTLDYLGTPYTVWVCTQHPGGLTADMLASGSHGNYYGVLLTEGSLLMDNGAGSWVSGLTTDEWNALWTYERNFGVRQINWYAFPTTTNGYGAAAGVDTTTTAVSAKLTAQGQTIFPYLNASGTVAIKNAWTYLAKPLDSNTVPLLNDTKGNALASVRPTADGREELTMTMDSNQYLNHAICMGYGLVRWVTRGLFLGEHRVFITPQVDDWFMDSDIYPNASSSFRLSGGDVKKVVDWESTRRATALTPNFTLQLAFNGEGVDDYGISDPLVTQSMKNSTHFWWINHTYDHPDPNLDYLTYDQIRAELDMNDAIAKKLKLPNYTRLNLVTPEVSGLAAAPAMQAIYDTGVRFVVSDTSKPGQANPTPNAGITNALQPTVLEIPRYPTNLFYNVSQPSEWVAEYNFLYRAFWGRNLTYAQILDKESDALLQYMLKGSIDPWMFHQANLHNYSGGKSLLSDLIDQALTKYGAISKFPLLSTSMDQLGNKMMQRMQYNAAGVTATLVPGVSITLNAQGQAHIPVTGLKGPGQTTYGGQTVSYVDLAGGSTTLPTP